MSNDFLKNYLKAAKKFYAEQKGVPYPIPKCEHDWKHPAAGFKKPRKCVKCGAWDPANDEGDE